MATKVFYHAHCRDGFTAAWAAWNKFHDDAEYIPSSYNSKYMPRVEEGDEVYIVDFSYKRPVIDDMLKTLGETGSLHILDHHASAEKILGDLDCATFDMDKSGARLAWEHFHPDTEVPPIVLYVEDNDLWRFDLEDSVEIANYISTIEHRFESWTFINDMLEDPLSRQRVVEIGAAVKRAIDRMVDQAVSNMHMEMVDGNEVPTVNSCILQTQIGARLNETYPDAKFAMVYFDSKDDKRICSLRTQRDDYDVSELATKFDGGGHPRAAAFSSKGVKQMISEAETLLINGQMSTQKLIAVLHALTMLNKRSERFNQGYTNKRKVMVDEIEWQDLIVAIGKLKKQMTAEMGVDWGEEDAEGSNIILLNQS